MKTVRFALILLALAFLAPWQSARAADVVCYNCPPEWADWASMLKAIKADLHYDIPHDNKNSGQALAQILAEKNVTVGDQFPKGFDMVARAPFDIVVNMSGAKVALPGAKVIEWPVVDPIGQTDAVYRAVAQRIEDLVMRLIIELRNAPR